MNRIICVLGIFFAISVVNTQAIEYSSDRDGRSAVFEKEKKDRHGKDGQKGENGVNGEDGGSSFFGNGGNGGDGGDAE